MKKLETKRLKISKIFATEPRVSSFDQNPARQLEGIKLDRRYIDKISGGTIDRPQLQEMLDYVREGDSVIVHSMDRLARNMLDLRKLVTD